MTKARIAIAAVLAIATSASAQNPGAAGGASAYPGAVGVTTVEQVELTEKSAKGAVDAYLEIKEKYGDQTPKGKSTAAGYAALEGVNGIVGEHGFGDTGEWHKTLTSVAIAYGFAKDGKTGSEVDESLAKIKDNPQIPENLKQQMISMIAGIRPSENNLSVVNALMKDDAWAAKLAALDD